ncbi:glycosyltransferase [Alteromonas macleodii]|uniref:glycosyltransferase n=1 Tax=Alteromonas macleodii TaxID=28108 RepID=UPI003140B2F0
MLRQAIICHLFYQTHIEKALNYLEESAGLADIYVTCNQSLSRCVIRAANKKGLSVQVRVFENRGMDILPFLKLLPELESSYDVVTKIHVKKEVDDIDVVWNKYTSESLVLSSVLRHVEHVFIQRKEVAFAGMAPFYLSCKKLMLGNEENFSYLLKNVPKLHQDWDSFGFFAGTNFSVRPKVLRHLSEWLTNNEHIFKEDYSKDGSWANALERVFLLTSGELDKVALIFCHENNVFSQICKPTEFVSHASTREVSNTLKFITEDSRDLSAILEHNKRDWGEQDFVGTPSYVPYYLFLEQFLESASQIESFRILKRQRTTINWQELKQKARTKHKVSIVIPVYNQAELTEACVRSIFTHNDDQILEVIAVDNGSDLQTKKVLQRLSGLFEAFSVVSLDMNLNFSLGCNIGFAKSEGDYIVFLNNDIEVTKGWLSSLVSPVKSGEFFATQPLLLYPDNTIQSVGITFNRNSCIGYGIYNGKPRSFVESIKNTIFSAVTAACICVKAKDFAEVEGFSPVYINGQEDIDLCLKLKRLTSLMAKVVTSSVLVHHESKSEGRFDNVKLNRHIFVKRWASYISSDDTNHYKDDGVLISSAKVDKNNIPFWIKSSTLEVEEKINTETNALVRQFYQKKIGACEALSSLMFLTQENPSLASSFQYTFENLRESLCKEQPVTRTVIIAKGAFTESHFLADSLYDFYKKQKSSVGVTVISSRERIALSSYQNMPQEQRQTDCLYVNAGEMRLGSLIQYALNHRADNIHLVDLSRESLILAAVYKSLYNCKIYAERLASLGLLSSLCGNPSDQLTALKLAELVVTKDFEREYLDVRTSLCSNFESVYSMIFVYEEENFIELAWFVNYVRRFFRAELSIYVLVLGDMKQSHKMLSIGENVSLIFLDEQREAFTIASRKTILFAPQHVRIPTERISNIMSVSHSMYLLPIEESFVNYGAFSQKNNSFNSWLETNSLSHELEFFRERRVDQLRDCKREAYSPLKNQHSLALLQGKMRKFIESS